MDEVELNAIAAAALEPGVLLHRTVAASTAASIAKAAAVVADALGGGGKLIAFGNGGSAADAQHLVAEFVGRFKGDRRALPAIALTTNSSILTAVSNDYTFDYVFARQIEALGAPGDVAVAISTSGRSPNVLAGTDAATAAGLTTIALTGDPESLLAKMADIAIGVPSVDTARIQEAHVVIAHALCECLEAILFPDGVGVPAILRPQRNTPASATITKLVELDELVRQRRYWRHAGTVVVSTNGCFDLLHAGHLEMLEAAGRLGDVLVVGINDDESVRALKGTGRPIVPVAERARMIAALEVVSRVVVFSEPTPEEMLRQLQPDVHCKGYDYRPPHGKPIPEASVVEEYGGRVEFLPLVPSRSTSSLIARVQAGTDT